MKLFYGEIFPAIKIHEDEQNHIIKVLRMREGEEIFITDGKGNSAKGNIQFEGKKIQLSNAEIKKNISDFSPKLHIAIAPTKNIDRIEFFIEKAVEMGISEITFLQTEKSERKIINVEKLEKQAISASKQSLRFHFPKINHLAKLSDFIKNLNSGNTYIAHCDNSFSRVSLHEIPMQEEINFLIGPEGDFSLNEIRIIS